MLAYLSLSIILFAIVLFLKVNLAKTPAAKWYINIVGKRVQNVFCRVLFTILFGLYIRLAFVITDRLYNENGPSITDAVRNYGLFLTIVLYSCHVSTYLNVPIAICNALGMLIFNPFVNVRKKNRFAMNTPFICFRVVTRGLYPKLVANITDTNLETCRKSGLEKFKFEIVTDKPLNIKTSNCVREVVVPSEYHTPNGTLFKARALHYCLNQNINILSRDDWIVHLDEETLLTDSVLSGIVNFASNQDSSIGQGVITYGECGIENWLTTLIDGVRVAIDYGMNRFASQFLHRPAFGFKGSFIVVKMGIEEDIGFDFGPKESIAEDLRFALEAWYRGYKFEFVEGVMKEKSPFSIADFVKQRKRWFIGHFHIIWGTCHTLPLYCKLGVLTLHISNILLWTNVINSIISIWFPVPLAKWQLCMFALLTFHAFFNFAFGNFMSICNRRYSLALRVVICILSQCLMPVLGVCEAYAFLKGLFGRNKITFDIVQKETKQLRNQKRGIERV